LIEPATEDEMVLAFLRAELDSPTYPSSDNTAGVRFWVAQRDLDPSLIEHGDATDAAENTKRLTVLGDWRGYRRNTLLFDGFPSDVEWHRGALTPEELGQARYTVFPPWPDFSNGERTVSAGAANVGKTPHLSHDPSPAILAIADRITTGSAPAEPPILVGPPDTSVSELVLVEGYKRATAYVYVGGSAEIAVLVGFTERLREWLPSR
jgi:hypothetical protein